MSKLFIMPFILFTSLSPALQIPSELDKTLNNILNGISQVNREIDQVADILLLGNEIATGSKDIQHAKEIKLATRQVQRSVAQMQRLKRELASPKSSRVHVILLLVKKLEEVILYLKKLGV